MIRTMLTASILTAVTITGCDPQTETLTYSPTGGTVEKVVTTVDIGDVNIRPGSGLASVEVETHWVVRPPDVSFHIKDGILYVTSDCGEDDPQCRADIDLTIPADTPYEVRGGESTISAEGVHGDAVLSTDLGDISLDDIEGALEMSVGEGEIRGDDVRSDTVAATVVQGDATLTFKDGAADVSVESEAGDIRLVVPPTSYTVDAASSGALNIGVPRTTGAERRIKARTQRGDVSIRPQAILLGAPFELKFGKTAQLSDTSLSLAFDGIIEDSRCPIHTTCAWEGRVIVALTAMVPDGTKHSFELELGSEEGVFEYNVALDEVLPQLTEKVPVPRKEAYALTLTVDPAE